MAAIELSDGDATAVVSPADGGRLASLVIAGRERLVTGSGADDPKLWGVYPMAPWAGRIRRGRLTFEDHTYDLPIDAPPHAIHGTVYRRPWEAEDDGTLVAPGPPPWDDCFVALPAPARLTFADGLQLTVTSDADHWVIYTPDHAVCVETQTGPPDGPNSSPHVIEPGVPLSLTMTLTWTAPA